jgi:hypothetical protein
VVEALAAAPFDSDEAGLVEHGQVLHGRVSSDLEMPGDVTGGPAALAEQVEDGPPRRVAQARHTESSSAGSFM